MNAVMATATVTLEKLPRNGGQEIFDFYRENKDGNIHLRSLDAFKQAAKNDAVTILRDWEGTIIAAAIAWKHGQNITEIGSVLGLQQGYSLMEVLIAFQIAEWVMAQPKANEELVCDVHDDNIRSLDLFSRLQFREWRSPDQEFVDSKKATIVEPADPSRPVSYFHFERGRFHFVQNAVNFGTPSILRHDENGQMIKVDTSKHPCSSRWDPFKLTA